mmetsp:Transcript_32757/g.71529  ORF Transcript_32757/g.71529 Transcript_32757/m.71529 type:complete len:192 (+) Transcript_32757:65-640(+)|eukprot:CAMPEP_0170616092 /NCGR_PEP_ID=MMETSP0224-20130122/25691_1 /TAXON_ID=285029 /ORGANISM="Togula jolla, Strain CCCM 725" /LENGTH=191 /DNA_ID=CAMNT_0010941877 /DNA_START=64 /DNA_END=639 /DNA_ORIENTATION=-
MISPAFSPMSTAAGSSIALRAGLKKRRSCGSPAVATLIRLAALCCAATFLATAFAAPHLRWGHPAARRRDTSAILRRADLTVSDPGQLTLSEENVEKVLEFGRWDELAGCLGYAEESLKVGIDGHVDLVELEGPTVVISLTGHFWHRRSDVLLRVEQLLITRIPEIAEVVVADPDMLLDTEKKTFYHYKDE